MTQSIPLSELESSAAASFDNIGDKYVGVIVAIKQQQQTDPVTGAPKVFPSGDPMMLWIITIQQDGDPEPVALWAKGGNYVAVNGTGKAMLPAIGEAVKAANANSVDVGGRLAVAHTGLSEAKPGMSPAKLYTAQYQPPTAQPQAVPVEDLFSQ